MYSSVTLCYEWCNADICLCTCQVERARESARAREIERRESARAREVFVLCRCDLLGSILFLSGRCMHMSDMSVQA